MSDKHEEAAEVIAQARRWTTEIFNALGEQARRDIENLADLAQDLDFREGMEESSQ